MEQRLSLITLSVGDVSRGQAFYEALGWHLNGGGEAVRPGDGPDQPRVTANQRIPGGLVAGAKAAASWDTGIDSSTGSGYKRATSLRKHS
jgi:hypothetical protein